jgi:hypothetical protein
MTQSRRNLIVSRIGSKSLHDNWLSPERSRNFDVVLSCYDVHVPRPEKAGFFFEYRPGRKIQGYDGFLTEQRDIWRKYDYICLMDEDLVADTSALNRMFDLCAAHNLKIAQPSLTHDSFFTYAALLHQPQWTLRFVNFIEMMCPVFHRDTLEKVAPLYAEGYESGIDLVWCNAVFESTNDFAVLDSVQVRHSEPVGEHKSQNGFSGGRVYEDDIYAALSQYNLPWLPCVPYGALAHEGKLITSPLRFKLAALKLLPAVVAQKPWLPRLRSVLLHFKHLHTRLGTPIASNIKIEIASEPRISPEGE